MTLTYTGIKQAKAKGASFRLGPELEITLVCPCNCRLVPRPFFEGRRKGLGDEATIAIVNDIICLLQRNPSNIPYTF